MASHCSVLFNSSITQISSKNVYPDLSSSVSTTYCNSVFSFLPDSEVCKRYDESYMSGNRWFSSADPGLLLF